MVSVLVDMIFKMNFLHLAFNAKPTNFLTKHDNIYVLSEETASFSEAENSCQFHGGEVAQIAESDKVFFEKALRNKYISDSLLTTVRFHVQTTSRQTTQNSNLMYDAYRYVKPDITPAKTYDAFTTPGNNRLKSIMAYERRYNEFDQQVTICSYDEGSDRRDTIFRECSDGTGWTQKFIVYSGNRSTSNNIKIYHWIYLIGERITSQLTLTSSNFNKDFVTSGEFDLYIPDISLFVGANSTGGKSGWFWKNGTKSNESIPPASNSSDCEQLTWPLTYDDGKNFRAKGCGPKDKSYYICQAKFVPVLNEIDCDGTFNLSWNSLLSRIDNAVDIKITANDNVSYSFTNSSLSKPFVELTLLELQQEKTLVQVELTFSDFPELNLSAVANVTSIKQNIKTASAKNIHESQCEISWNYNFPGRQNETFIKLHVMTSNETAINSTIVEVSAEQSSSGSIQHYVSLETFPDKTTVYFKIQLFLCGREGELTEVNGSCTKSSASAKNNTLFVAISIAGGSAAMFLILVGFYCRCKSRKYEPESDAIIYQNSEFHFKPKKSPSEHSSLEHNFNKPLPAISDDRQSVDVKFPEYINTMKPVHSVADTANYANIPKSIPIDKEYVDMRSIPRYSNLQSCARSKKTYPTLPATESEL